MTLKTLIEKLSYEVVQGNENIEITELVFDSRKACENGVFVCISGAVVDGHTFVEEVVQKGITAVVVEKEVSAPEGVTIIRVDSTRLALACMSAAFFGYPAKELKTIGITGTKGKTTTSYMLWEMLTLAGHNVGLIGTIEIQDGRQSIPAASTRKER